MDYIYAKLNQEIKKITYAGTKSSTAEVIVDQDKSTIGVNVISSPYAEQAKQAEYDNNGVKLDSDITEILYADLVTLKANGKLKPGHQYRITDFVTTTSQAETQSAGHVFDIIVRAVSVSVINENAMAIQHEGDTYFEKSKLTAWQLKYCLDNDSTRFAWASTTGKGVIYWMKDEFNNECPYDFKNIQFKRYKVIADSSHASLSSLDNKFLGYILGEMNGFLIANETEFIWCYTFTIDNDAEGFALTDASLNPQPSDSDGGGYSGGLGSVCNNKLLYTVVQMMTDSSNPINAVQSLNNIVLYSLYYTKGLETAELKGSSNVVFDSGCFNITLIRGSGSLFSYNCKNIILGDCSSNSFGNNCYSNSFGNSCYNNSFGNSCHINSFGDDCNNNSFGNSCHINSFGDDCNNSSFGNYCYSNSFGNNCNSNSFGNSCSSNSFGDDCYSNSFGNDCYSNSFGDGCVYNNFGEGVNTVAVLDYCQYNIFDSGVSFVDIKTNGSWTGSNYLQNIHIHQGVTGSSDAHKIITISRNNTFCTDVVSGNDVEVTA